MQTGLKLAISGPCGPHLTIADSLVGSNSVIKDEDKTLFPDTVYFT